jgi:hypothetical protein
MKLSVALFIRLFMSKLDPFSEGHAKVEMGVFDLSRLPFDWSRIPVKEINDMTRKFEATASRQVKQLEKRYASAGIGHSSDPTDCETWGKPVLKCASASKA